MMASVSRPASTLSITSRCPGRRRRIPKVRRRRVCRILFTFGDSSQSASAGRHFSGLSILLEYFHRSRRNPMKTTITLTAAVLVLLTAACSPTDSLPRAYAEPAAAAVALYPEPAAGATDGHVDEYH
jgi:hypothetical protein